jgi:hypothetical protein
MQRILTGFAMAAIFAVVPTLALGGNQEAAEQIAQNLRDSGQMSNYKISVKYHDGVAQLHGWVTDEEQMGTALKLVFQSKGVTRVVNELTIAGEPAQEEPAPAVANPIRSEDSKPVARTAPRSQKLGLVKRLESMVSRGSSEQQNVAQAERVPSSFTPSPVEKASAVEMQEEMPQQMAAPQRARPMGAKYVAMNQPCMRGPMGANGSPMPMYAGAAGGVAPARCDQASMPNYAWPSYAAYPNYAAVTYPKQYSPTAWPYIGPFYPYPQVPLGWRKVTLEWDDGWWFLDFKDQPSSCWHR